MKQVSRVTWYLANLHRCAFHLDASDCPVGFVLVIHPSGPRSWEACFLVSTPRFRHSLCLCPQTSPQASSVNDPAASLLDCKSAVCSSLGCVLGGRWCLFLLLDEDTEVPGGSFGPDCIQIDAGKPGFPLRRCDACLEPSLETTLL